MKHYIIGVDTGFLSDRSAVSMIEHDRSKRTYECVYLGVWQPGTPHTRMLIDIARIVQHIRKPQRIIPNMIRSITNTVDVVVDTTIAGESIGDAFRQKLVPEGVRTYTATVATGTLAANQGKAVRVAKRELCSLMRVLLEERRFRYAAGLEYADVLRRELQNFKADNTSTNDNEIDWRTRPNDDLVLATALACWLPSTIKVARIR